MIGVLLGSLFGARFLAMANPPCFVPFSPSLLSASPCK